MDEKRDFRATARPLSELPAKPGSSADFRCTCPNCGAELWDKECKSRCPRCHFFTDCSDPW